MAHGKKNGLLMAGLALGGVGVALYLFRRPAAATAAASSAASTLASGASVTASAAPVAQVDVTPSGATITSTDGTQTTTNSAAHLANILQTAPLNALRPPVINLTTPQGQRLSAIPSLPFRRMV